MLTEPSKHKQSVALVDRRKHTRFNLRPGTFAGCSPNIGEIVDISLGGIAFNYVEFGGKDFSQLKFIICAEDGCCLDNLSYTVISDKVCISASGLSHIVTRLRRIQFNDLTDDQSIMLQNFINNNIVSN